MAAKAQTEAAAPLPPQNIDAEEYVLGAMLLSPTAIDAVRAILQPRDFWRESHGRIYRAAVDLHSIGHPVDPLTLADELGQRGELDQIGGKDRIREIATLVPASSNAAHHAAIVERMARFRDYITFSEQVAALGWNAGDYETSTARAQELFAGLQERTIRHELDVETWHQFEAQAHDHIPTLIDRLWPEGAFGFIAAPPKKGKTWVALALAIAVSTGRPLFGHFQVPTPRPVLYIALEGHRAALRARVGAIARGMGIDPDTDELNNLHWLYKPRGINLADRTWADRIRRAADKPDAALITIDVMRASARLKENDQESFSGLRANLQPITDDGRAIAMLHHNVKLSEISKERDPGERMSGSGAMYGALDVGIYITGSDEQASKLRLDFDLRDLATPPHINIHLTGDGTGDNGGYTYRDTAAFIVVSDEVAEDSLKAPPTEIIAFIKAMGGTATGPEICAHFVQDDKLLSSDTLTARVPALERMGVVVDRRRGNRGNLYTIPAIAESPSIANQQWSLDQQYEPHNNAGLPFIADPLPNDPTGNGETLDMQAKSIAGNADSPTGSAATKDGAALLERALALVEHVYTDDSPLASILALIPTLPADCWPQVEQAATERARQEFGT